MTRFSIFLRLAVGVGIVSAVLVAGFQHRSPWIVLPLAMAFAVMYVAGKPLLLRRMGPVKLLLSSLAAIPAQVLVVGVIFSVGYGVASMSGEDRPMLAFGERDLHYSLWVLAIGGALGTLAAMIELRSGDPMLDLEPDEFLDELMKSPPGDGVPRQPRE